MSGLSVGVDVGGTFTDLAAIAPDGGVRITKVLTQPCDQSGGVMDALAALGEPGARVQRLVHGTTAVTNLLLERTGARVALCATAGHTDVLHLRRQDRAALYDLSAHHPAPLVERAHAVAVPERMGPDGVVRALELDAIAEVVEAVRALAPEAVAVSLLHAYAHDAHERALADALEAALPDVDVVRSSVLHPEIREYERTSTTVAEAYARPRVRRYLERLGQRLTEGGFPAPGVMTSGGGVRAAHEASRSAAALALSGPAGGVVGAAAVLRALDLPLGLTIDIGGTSADVGLVMDGEALVESGGEVAGVPIALPRVLVETVSAGGGSIGWVDDAGALRVGPRSAGAEPGPAAFGRGGTQATVTDAHLLLGHLGAVRLSGGVHLDVGAATTALRALAERLGQAADGAARVARAMLAAADAAMARALRRVSVERGLDPRGMVLVAFGGGGPLHACALAERLGMRRVLVPPHAGVLSAVGLASAPERREALTSVMRDAATLDGAAMAALVGELTARAGAGAEHRTWARARYAGQGHELEIPVQAGDDGAALAARFSEAHARRVGFTLPRAVEIVSARHAASTVGPAARFARTDATATESVQRADGAAVIVDAGGPVPALVRGPATIVLPDATALVPAGWTARALDVGGWMVEAE
ncbi:hydantoinase/oxoprolinase family protein [Roseisolibacter agri]|uniref:Hydantoinase n=1 Tax=Roseisolibacter agri TaxID=2014610 RepID=A0AA37Q9R6_9BACT|nr:hydantoinase/oxoprolinase family protein [Roseisolibacter agri]GLC26327.1 hydantoinase [Roseisolibacter agri]